MPDPKGILILGGTAEARALAALAVAEFGQAVTTSLAGVTKRPAELPGRVRVGGFGGAPGLARYLVEERIGALLDATHPFAAHISAHAAEAAADAGVPRVALVRPPWPRQPGDRWIEVDDFDAARLALDGRPANVFLAIGRKELARFQDLSGFRFHVRLFERPDDVLPLNDYSLTVARGPFTVAGERALFERERIATLVCKASGGEEGYAKIAAAREQGVTVVMVRRPPPPPPPGPTVATAAEAMAWLKRTLGV